MKAASVLIDWNRNVLRGMASVVVAYALFDEWNPAAWSGISILHRTLSDMIYMAQFLRPLQP